MSLQGERVCLISEDALQYDSLAGETRRLEDATSPTSSVDDDDDASGVCFPKGGRGSFNIQSAGTESARVEEDDDSNASTTDNQMDISLQLSKLNPASVMKAVVFIEDAFYYRSIYHKVGPAQLSVYRKRHSTAYDMFRRTVIFILHILAFFEFPSSLTITSDLRIEGERIQAPCWLTQTIEILCLIFLLLDNIMRVYCLGRYYFVRHKWDLMALIFLLLSLIDWAISLGLGCHEFVRYRRFLRPFFILQNSSMMKKIVACLFASLPEILSILLMLAMHLVIFTVLGMLIFPQDTVDAKNITSNTLPFPNVTISPVAPKQDLYFKSFLDSLISLLVLLTTANNPDVTMPAYSRNRFSSLFFVLYLLIGLYCFMNILLAVVYNQFRGYFQGSLQSSLLRRRLGVRASFEVLRRRNSRRSMQSIDVSGFIGNGVGGYVIQMVVEKTILPKHIKDDLLQALHENSTKLYSAKEYQDLFYRLDKETVCRAKPRIQWCESPFWRKVQKVVTSRYFVYFGIIVVFCNLCIITIQMTFKYDSRFRDDYILLFTVNFSFVFYYVFEQCAKVWAFGWRRYLYHRENIFDAAITVALVITEICCISLYGFPHDTGYYALKDSRVLWNIIRIINILIMVRMGKIIPHIKAMSLVASVIIDLVKNMKAFAGILVVLFYAFAILGIELFHGDIEYKASYANVTFECGSYEQLNYWANNFDDFFASIIVLWDIMIVNNWHVFLAVFREKTTPWSYLYFIAWWLLSVIVVLNLFTALIMENFIMKWDRRSEGQRASFSTEDTTFTTVSLHLSNVHSMFKDLLHEPADNELLQMVNSHQFMTLDH